MIPTRFNPMGTAYLRKVQYLAATGTQYIDTGLKPIVDFTEAEITLSSGCSCGSRAGYMNGEFRITTNYTNFDTAFGSAYSNTSADFTVQHEIKMKTDGTFYLDGTLIYTGSGSPTQAYNYWLFCFCSANSAVVSGAGRIYRAIMRNGSALVRDFIPVLDKASQPCMFDQITQTLFYNAGSGNFTYA